MAGNSRLDERPSTRVTGTFNFAVSFSIAGLGPSLLLVGGQAVAACSMPGALSGANKETITAL